MQTSKRPTTHSRADEASSPQPAKATQVPVATPLNVAAVSYMEQMSRYQIDRWQRSVLFLDMLRERANNMLAHEEAGMPAPLDFEYETFLDARHLEHPANYALLRITGCHEDHAEDCVDD